MPRTFVLPDLGEGLTEAEIVRVLVAAKANPNIADRQGVTPLQHARSRCYRETAALLEKAGGR